MPCLDVGGNRLPMVAISLQQCFPQARNCSGWDVANCCGIGDEHVGTGLQGGHSACRGEQAHECTLRAAPLSRARASTDFAFDHRWTNGSLRRIVVRGHLWVFYERKELCF